MNPWDLFGPLLGWLLLGVSIVLSAAVIGLVLLIVVKAIIAGIKSGREG